MFILKIPIKLRWKVRMRINNRTFHIKTNKESMVSIFYIHKINRNPLWIYIQYIIEILMYGWVLRFHCSWVYKATFTPDSRPTLDQCRPFLWVSRVWSGKIYPLSLKSVSMSGQHLLYRCSIPDASTLKSRSSRPIPVLPADQSPLCTTNPRPIPGVTTLTTFHILGPTPDLYAWFPLSVSNK